MRGTQSWEEGNTVEKKREPFESGSDYAMTAQEFSVPKSQEGDLPCLQTKMNSSVFLKYSILIGLSMFLELGSGYDLGATVYTCRDRMGQTIFTDSPAQLKNCKVFSSPTFPSNGKEQADQEQLSVALVPEQNAEPAFSGMLPNLELSKNAESESIPTPPALYDNKAPASSPFSILAPWGLPPGLEDLLAPGTMPPPEIFKEITAPQGLDHDNSVSPYLESRKGLMETEFGSGFFVPPNIKAPPLSEIPFSNFSNPAAVPHRK